MKVIRSGDLIEVYEYAKNLPIRRKVRQPDTYGKRDRRVGPRREDSIRRAAKSFRRIVRANLGGDEPPALFTFTMYQELSYTASVRVFTKFIVRLRRNHGREFRYIVVPEFQKRGAVHWHALFWGISHEIAKTETETRYIARLWLAGFCDGLITDGHPKLAGYLSKYMSKAMHDIRLGGKKAYYASRNILRPMCVSSANVVEYLSEIVGVDNSPLHTHEFDTQWLGRAIYKQYNA